MTPSFSKAVEIMAVILNVYALIVLSILFYTLCKKFIDNKIKVAIHIIIIILVMAFICDITKNLIHIAINSNIIIE